MTIFSASIKTLHPCQQSPRICSCNKGVINALNNGHPSSHDTYLSFEGFSHMCAFSFMYGPYFHNAFYSCWVVFDKRGKFCSSKMKYPRLVLIQDEGIPSNAMQTQKLHMRREPCYNVNLTSHQANIYIINEIYS